MRYVLKAYLLIFLLLSVAVAVAQPGNDLCSGATDITSDINSGSCTSYTNVNATDDIEGSCNNNLCSGGPSNNPNEDVWFSFTAPVDGDVQITINGYTWGSPNYDPIVTIFDACNSGNQLSCSNAGDDGTNDDSIKTVTFTTLDSNTTYYFSVDGPCSDEGTFCLEIEFLDPSHCSNSVQDADETGVDCGGISCVACHCSNSVQDADETGVDCGGVDCVQCMSCTDNEDCGSATTLTLTGTDTLSVCLTDCNTGASTESWNFAGGCTNTTNAETVYYTFTSTEYYLDISLTSSDISEPQIVLLTDDCSGYYGTACDVGSGGSASVTGFPAGNGTTYTLMVTTQSGDNGIFNLCIYNYPDNSACALDDSITANPPPDTSGGFFQGGYPPNTTVEFCYTLATYSQVNCVYLHGFVPVIGSGWLPFDTADVTVPPVSVASIMGSPAGIFSWFDDGVVQYNSTGVDVGAGWFFLTSYCEPNCSTGGHGGDPNDSYGDANFPKCTGTNNDGTSGTWNFCFELTTPSTCVPGADLTVGIKTYADGETGAWSNLGCQVDLIAYPPIASPGSICASCSILSVATSNVLCNGNSTGTATTVMDSSGTPPYTYSWNTSPVQTDSVATGLAAGTYQVNVTDSTGCMDSSIITITEPAALAAQITDSTMILCFGDATGSATVSTVGGVTPYTFLWDDGAAQTDSIATGLIAGTYQVMVTDSNGCSDSASIIITQPAAALSASITGFTNLICNGVPTGDATVTAVGGTTAYTYLWDDPLAQTNTTAAGLLAGIYQVVVTDANSCQDSATITLTEAPALVLAITDTTDANCSASDGNATVTPGGGTGAYTYLWDDPGTQTDSVANGLAAASYQVIVTDGNGCQDSISINISNLGGGTVSITDSTHILCNGDSTGMATVTPVGGTAPFTYVWNTVPVQTDSIANGVPAGSYTATVTDNVNCIALATFTVTEPLAISLVLVSTTDVACNGDSTGSLEINASGGVAPYTYLWDDPSTQTDSVANGIPAGTYKLIVTDANGCLDSISVAVTEPTVLSLTISDSTMVGCNGDSTGSATVTPSGGNGPYTYQWDDASTQTDSVVVNIPNGTYQVLVTDANGCVDSLSTTITEPSVLSLSTVPDSTSCNGYSDGKATVTVVGGTANFNYVWSSGDSTINVAATVDSSTDLSAGTYYITVTDINGCVAIDSTIVEQPLDVTVSIVQDSLIGCSEDSTAVATAILNFGASPFNYEWSSGDTLLATTDTFNTVNNLAAGTYTVQVADASGCINSDSIVITQPSTLDLASTVNSHVSCNGGSDGSATVNAKSTGTSPWDFVWSNGDSTMSSASTINSVTGLTAGTYYVTVTDSNGCSDIDTSIITEPAALALSTATTAASCGASDGNAIVSVAGGTGAYTYAWNDLSSQTTDTASALNAGGYIVIVTDSNSCIDSASVTVGNLGGASITIDSITDLLCNGDTNGAISISVSGGTAPLTYLWNNSDTLEDIIGLAVGSYAVTVTDANLCITMDSAMVSEPLALSLTTASAGASCGATDGSASVSVTGGTGSYTYLWNDPSFQTTDTAMALAAGPYAVVVTDSNACVAGATATVGNIGGASITIDVVVDVLCNGDSTGSINITVSGGAAPLTYLWSNTDAIEDISGLTAGTYSITVTDANTCITVDSGVVSEPFPLVLTTSKMDASCGNTNGYATVAVTGGTGPYSYAWNDPATQTTDTASALSGGVFTVVVTDANSCVSTASESLSNLGGASITLDSVINLACNGDANGSISITVSGGTTPYIYLWDDPSASTSEDVDSLTAGFYTVAVTDSSGCIATLGASITEPVALSVTATSLDISCYGADDGSGSASVSGGAGQNVYLWNDLLAQTTSTALGLDAGTFTVNVTDSAGCAASASVTINEPPAITLTTVSTDNCMGETVATATATASGGTGTLTYDWDDSNVQTTVTATGLSAGLYTVTVEDGSGCLQTATAIVNDIVLPTISAGADEQIAIGGSATLSASGGLVYNWTPSTGLSCTSCQTTIAAPIVTTDYIVIGTDNCSSSDTVTVFVDNKITMFIPDIFSPNGDNENDYLFVQGKGIQIVETFVIYDRWGEKVFENTNFQVFSDEEANKANGWDGMYKGSVMNPAVFVYYVKIIFVDNSTQEEKGDITLVH